MKKLIIVALFLAIFLVGTSHSSSSPIKANRRYDHAVELEPDAVDLWWNFDDSKDEIVFELHAKTNGWIALGISPAGGMKAADMAIGWVDSTGQAYLQDRFSLDKGTPMIDNTTQDWFLIKGQQENGWTSIQFKRKLDSCDPMDVSIKSGTTIVIFAYGLVDPDVRDPNRDIDYHEHRKGTRMIPLLSYADPPEEDSLTNLQYIDLRLENNVVPSTDTTYYCKVFKMPRFTNKTHAIGHKILIDPRNPSLVHHLDLWQCSPKDLLNDENLPDGICDEIFSASRSCSSILTTSWAIGGDLINIYQKEVGYPISDAVKDKYFMIKIHYDNPTLKSGLRDSSGVRFYIGDKLRENDLAYFVLGTPSRPSALAIPPRANRFAVDCYCPPEVTRNFPSTGLKVLSALPHTHLQGVSVWTKLIRNNKAVQYLFNAETFDFNYQFENRLAKSIEIFPGDAFVTRCVYTTTNKETVTLGGQRTIDEMCSHTFSYYPAIDHFSACFTSIDEVEWSLMINSSSQNKSLSMEQWLVDNRWTEDSIVQWQQFYNKAKRIVLIDRHGQFERQPMSNRMTYEDLVTRPCNRTIDGMKNASIGLGTSLQLTSTLLMILFTVTMKLESMCTTIPCFTVQQ